MNLSFSKAFISHRSQDYSKAFRLKELLIKQGISNDVVLWENESLCFNFEQLTVCEYFEALDKIRRSMKDCDAFIIIDCSNYENGYFTSAELLTWRSLHGKHESIVWRVKENNGSYSFLGREIYKPLTFRQRHSIGFSSYYIHPDYTDPELAFQMDNWGKYGRNCFLVGCCKCGEYYLVSKGAMEWYIKTHHVAVCPNCSSAHATFTIRHTSKRLLVNRDPIVMNPLVKPCDLQNLGLFELLWLMSTGNIKESRFKLVAIEGEKFESDAKKASKSIFKFAVGLWSIVAGGIYLINKYAK